MPRANITSYLTPQVDSMLKPSSYYVIRKLHMNEPIAGTPRHISVNRLKQIFEDLNS